MEKKSGFEKSMSTISWIKIMLSPTLIFGFIGLILMINLESNLGNFLFGFLLCAGIVLGVWWANKIKKEGDTTDFISQTDSSPDLKSTEDQ